MWDQRTCVANQDDKVYEEAIIKKPMQKISQVENALSVIFCIVHHSSAMKNYLCNDFRIEFTLQLEAT